MLLLVIGAAVEVDLAGDLGAFGERFADEMPDLAGFVFDDALNGDLECSAAGRGGDEDAGVPGLAAAFRVEGGAVERELPDVRVVGGRFDFLRDEANVGDARGELEDGRVVVEALSCCDLASAESWCSVCG